jgi:hypothetical protein
MVVKLGLLTLREEHNLKVFEKRVLRGYLDRRWIKYYEAKKTAYSGSL